MLSLRIPTTTFSFLHMLGWQECTSSNCSCGPSACCNRPFAQLHASGALPLQLIKTERKGWGVKATRDICEGELVIEYVGEVIDRESWEVCYALLCLAEPFF